MDDRTSSGKWKVNVGEKIIYVLNFKQGVRVMVVVVVGWLRWREVGIGRRGLDSLRNKEEGKKYKDIERELCFTWDKQNLEGDG